MVLLALVLTLLFSDPVFASLPEESKSVLFDLGDPRNSVAVIGDQIFQMGDEFENYKIAGFEPDAIVVQDQASLEMIKWPAADKMSSEMLRDARHAFIARQMKAIHLAQVEYLSRFHDHYARSLEVLIQQDLLADGFNHAVKQGYRFEVIEAAETFGKEPVYRVLASPVQEIAPDLFFMVDQLGNVRFAETTVQVPWGPVWDYADRRHPKSIFIGAENNKPQAGVTL